MLITLIVVVAAIIMITCELIRPGRRWPAVTGWWLRAILFNAIQVVIVFAAGLVWDGWMIDHRPWRLDTLGTTAGAIIGYLVITFIYYWWHRWRHEIPFLWRWLHQFHHSPQRIEIITSFYKHPLEIAINGLLSSAILYLLVGLTPQAAAVAVLMTGLAELFYHWNVPTPHWLGYIFQRPESHCVHHQENRHTNNFSDLPLWDILFGTFDNPKKWEARCGFAQREHAIGAMLIGRDVNINNNPNNKPNQEPQP